MLFSKNKGMRIIYSLPVLLLFLTIAGLYYCYLEGFLLRLPIENVIVSGIIFHISLILLIWSYLMSVITDPGTIPNDFSPQILNSSAEDLNLQDLTKARVTTCKVCKLRRPPRTHHCLHCDRCILRRDHHCPWVANCVGFYNHRFFLQFLTYTTISSLILTFSCLASNEMLGWDENIQSLVGFIMGVLVSAGIGGFAIFHYYIACLNITSTEYKPSMAFNIFDMKSAKKNCAQIFGKKVLGYLLPIRTHYGIDPAVYPLRIRNSQNEVFVYENRLFE